MEESITRQRLVSTNKDNHLDDLCLLVELLMSVPEQRRSNSSWNGELLQRVKVANRTRGRRKKRRRISQREGTDSSRCKQPNPAEHDLGYQARSVESEQVVPNESTAKRSSKRFLCRCVVQRAISQENSVSAFSIRILMLVRILSIHMVHSQVNDSALTHATYTKKKRLN